MCAICLWPEHPGPRKTVPETSGSFTTPKNALQPVCGFCIAIVLEHSTLKSQASTEPWPLVASQEVLLSQPAVVCWIADVPERCTLESRNPPESGGPQWPEKGLKHHGIHRDAECSCALALCPQIDILIQSRPPCRKTRFENQWARRDSALIISLSTVTSNRNPRQHGGPHKYERHKLETQCLHRDSGCSCPLAVHPSNLCPRLHREHEGTSKPIRHLEYTAISAKAVSWLLA